MQEDLGSRLFQGALYVFIIAGIISACGIVLFWFIGRMLGRKLTDDLESMKGELSKKLEVHRLLHQYRADAIDKIYILLAKLARETAMLADYQTGPSDPHRQFKMSVMASTFSQLADHLHENKLYFPDAVTSRIQTFLTELREAIDATRPSIITYYTTQLHAPGQAERWSRLNYELQLLTNDVQALARGIIGLNPQGEPEAEVQLHLPAPAPSALPAAQR
jgi:hypothetical protein